MKALTDVGLEVVIGLETHIRLNTKTKLFCGCKNTVASMPNIHICSVCTGQMGVLPAVNKEAIKKAVLFGKAVQSQFKNDIISWDRKHYEYPDLPKNYQLTQFRRPIITDGFVDCFREDGSVFRVELEQVHIEEDAAKLVHERKQTLVDFNKGGVPLIEVVTKPCIQSLKDASTYAQYVQRIVQTLGISEANLEKGEFKSDISVSLRKIGSKDLNPRTEIKNLNSFKFMVEALQEEVEKQLAYYLEHNKFRPDQTTVLWDETLKQTKTMRKKEFAADYRYAPEPDIPPVAIGKYVESISIDLQTLPFQIEEELILGGVRPQDAKFFTSDPARADLFKTINQKVQDTLFVAKALLNNLKPEEYSLVTNVLSFVEMVKQYKEGRITQVLFQKAVSLTLRDPSFDFHSFFRENLVDGGLLEKTIVQVMEQHPEIVDEIKNGNAGKAGVLVGFVLKILGKGANGKEVRERVLALLNPEEKVSDKKQENYAISKKYEEETEERFKEIVVKDRYRTHLHTEIHESLLNKAITVSGWVASVRDHGDLVFIDLRDSSYEILQIRLDRKQFTYLDRLAKIKPESVVYCSGTVIRRTEDDYNTNIKTGHVELIAESLEVLNASKTLPFEIKRAHKSNENVRFRYKFLDHRNEETRNAIIHRHRVIKLIRDFLDQERFIEVETPILSAGTDEGAREFIVPSRKFPGRFYTLPQAPQQFKQMLMVGGFERYFQIARCFRDEDSRGDRQPEFTQLDMELSFVGMQEVIDLNTRLFVHIVEKTYGKKWKLFPFRVLTYAETMDKYGTDRPDLRFGLEMQDITEIVRETEFQVFSKPIEDGGIVKCIRVPKEAQKTRLSKGQIEKLTQTAQENGLGGLAYIFVNEDGLQSPIIKFLGEDICQRIIEASEARVGDIVFFSAAEKSIANKALDAVRQELGHVLRLIQPKELHPAWIIDFPFFEKTEEGNWTFTHNPFSMPQIEDLDKHMEGQDLDKIIAQQYDLVLNGYEIGGGSIRAHKAEILEATYRNMGYGKEEMRKSVGHMYDAFQFGAPPHGGIAWGIDRLMMILEKKQSIRDVMAYPKTGSGEDLFFNSPSELSEKKIAEQNVKVIRS